MSFCRYFLLVFCMATACSEDYDPVSVAYPRMNTLSVTDVTAGGALFHGQVRADGPVVIEEHGFIWGTVSNPVIGFGEVISASGPPPDENFSSALSRTLVANRVYHVRAYARAGSYLVYGDVVQFVYRP